MVSVTLLELIDSYLFQRELKATPTTVIFVDVNSEDTMPKLIDFMQKRCNAKIPKAILELAEVSLLKSPFK